jgi:hypothetical protein
MKVQLFLGSAVAAATISLSSGSEIDTDSDLSRHRLQNNHVGNNQPSDGDRRELNAVPSTRSFVSAKKQEETSMKSGKTGKMMTKASKTSEDEKSKAGKDPSSSKSGKMSGGKSGKTSKDAYYIGPISCPGRCIDVSGVNIKTGEMTDVLKACDNESKDQTWKIHNDDTFVKMESTLYDGMCIGIANRDSCESATYLVLGDCEHHESMWYFTGGQLISAYCWVNGYTNSITVSGGGSGQCDSGLYGYQDAFYVSQPDIFMFIDEEMIAPAEMPTEEPTIPTASPTFWPSYVPTQIPTA